MDPREAFRLLFGPHGLGRRGATALTFAVGASALFGVAGLATEGGAWYLEKRRGQNAADTAALSGVVALAHGQDARISGVAAASLGGYAAAGINVTTGSFSNGAFVAGASPATAVRTVVSKTVRPLFSALFIDGMVTIRETAVAVVAAMGPVCILAGPGGLSFGGSTSVSAVGCALASNRTGSRSIEGASVSHVSPAQSLVSAGGCSGCTGLTTAPLTYQPPTPVPAGLAAIEDLTLPVPGRNGASCNCAGNANRQPVPYGAGKLLNCDGLKLTGNATLDLAPGTYIFYNSGITLNNGLLTCTTCSGAGTSGVTVILTGDAGSIGTIDVKGNATVKLKAPATSGYLPAFDGVLFYTDERAPTNNTVRLTGNSNSIYAGALYFPSSSVTFIGNSGVNLPTCSPLVAYGITFTGNSGFSISGCAAQNVTRSQTIRLAQ